MDDGSAGGEDPGAEAAGAEADGAPGRSAPSAVMRRRTPPLRRQDSRGASPPASLNTLLQVRRLRRAQMGRAWADCARVLVVAGFIPAPPLLPPRPHSSPPHTLVRPRALLPPRPAGRQRGLCGRRRGAGRGRARARLAAAGAGLGLSTAAAAAGGVAIRVARKKGRKKERPKDPKKAVRLLIVVVVLAKWQRLQVGSRLWDRDACLCRSWWGSSSKKQPRQ
jgi:hypothetical protein